ncbi:MAG: dienelactone hydrolase family protein [Candidatus Baltobacteraceae bacterium]|jgi:carboxymethylenebutenolidase
MSQTGPARSASAALNRRAFVGLAAAAAAAGSSGGAFAQAETYGRPHAPIAPEDDPSIATARPQISQPGRVLDAYFALPKSAGPQTPGIVLVHHVWGVDAQMRDVARRLAKQGYITVVPDLYTGMNAPSGDGATDLARFRPFAQQLADSVVDGDLAASAAFLRSGAGGAPMKVGVLGFCGGGTIALRQTVDNASAFGAAVVFYGKVRYGTGDDDRDRIPRIGVAYAEEVGMPLLGNYGARDTSIPADDVRALDQRLSELRKPHDIKLYGEAGHAFFDDTRPSYVASAADDAWIRTLGWFGKYLH